MNMKKMVFTWTVKKWFKFSSNLQRWNVCCPLSINFADLLLILNTMFKLKLKTKYYESRILQGKRYGA